jgi:hypothetical protein
MLAPHLPNRILIFISGGDIPGLVSAEQSVQLKHRIPLASQTNQAAMHSSRMITVVSGPGLTHVVSSGHRPQPQAQPIASETGKSALLS